MNKKKYIKTLSQYLNWLNAVNQDFLGNEAEFTWTRRLFFRGHASTSWKMTPGIFRPENEHVDEHRLLLAATNALWQNTNAFNTKLEFLIFYQHYGLTTRLFDITYNPLVALYFACDGEDKDDNGIVLAGDADLLQTTELNYNAASKIADYIFSHSLTTGKTKGIPEKEAYQFCNAVYFDAPINSERISAQQGGFIIAPLIKDPVSGELAGKEYVEEKIKSMFNIETEAIIPTKAKHNLLKELDMCGVNQATIYCDIQSKLSYLNKIMKDRLLEVNFED